MARLTGVSPVLLVVSIERATAYYRDRLGFECTAYGDPPDFATADRDEATLLLALAPDAQRIVPHWRVVDRMWDAYIRVEDVDGVYAEMLTRGATIDYPIADTDHGFREFGIQDPDGHDIAIGERLRS
jgi:predicted enzyme related to lactoylglutathione lyase